MPKDNPQAIVNTSLMFLIAIGVVALINPIDLKPAYKTGGIKKIGTQYKILHQPV